MSFHTYTKVVMLFLGLTLLSTLNAKAESEKGFTFQGQREESFSLENILKGTEYREEQINTTCYRDIPYTENVCRMETRYRQECRQIPGRQECRTVYEPICRWETRYRQECTNTGGGRQCRTIPGDVQCRTMPNGENRCVKIPPREVCEDRPGQRICRQVPYQDRVCYNEPRNHCEWIPPRTACDQYPYQERVCRDEVRYRQEPYACVKTISVPYEVVLKTHKADVSVTFNDQAQNNSPIAFVAKLSEAGDVSLIAKDPNVTTGIFVRKNITNTDAGKENQITAHFPVDLVNLTESVKIARGSITNVDLGKHHLAFNVAGLVDTKRAKLYVRINKKDEVKFERSLIPSEYKVTNSNGESRITINLEKLGAPKLGGVFTTKHQINVQLTFDYSDLGTMLFPTQEALKLNVNKEEKVD